MNKMTQTSREYAVALFTLGKETNTEKEISDSLEVVDAVFKENPEYLEFLSSPSIPKKERLEALETLLEGRVHEYVCSFVCLLCEHGKIFEFSDCVEDYKSFFRMLEQISVAHVRSVIPLSEAQKLELIGKFQKICGHQVTLECTIDESLIGGMVVEIDGKVYDGSLKQYLSDIKEVMCQ